MKCLPGEVVGVRVGGVVSTAPVDTDPDVAPGRGGPGAGVGDDGFDISSAKCKTKFGSIAFVIGVILL